MLSITEGMRSRQTSSLAESDQDIVITAVGYRGGIRNTRRLTSILEEDAENISVAAPVLVSSVGLRHGEKWYPIIAIGFIPEKMEAFMSEDRKVDLFGLEMSFAEWFGTGKDPYFNDSYNGSFTGEALISSHLSESLDSGTGDMLLLGQSGTVERNFTVKGTFTTPLTGKGIFGMVIKGIVLLHLSELQSLIGAHLLTDTGEVDDRSSSIIISVNEDRKTSGDIGDIAFSIKERYPLFMVLTKNDRLTRVEERSDIADIFYTSAGSVSLVIGLLFVACIMIISIYERQKDIGILRAIGISKRTIFGSIFFESLILIFLGASLGIIPGYFGSEYMGSFMSEKYGLDLDFTSFTLSLVVKCLAYVLVVGCFFALIPALKASRLRVVDAMNK